MGEKLPYLLHFPVKWNCTVKVSFHILQFHFRLEFRIAKINFSWKFGKFKSSKLGNLEIRKVEIMQIVETWKCFY